MCYDMSLRYYEINVYDYVLDFSLLGIRLIPFCFMCRQISFRGGKIRDAWRMCIDGEWSQGAERYSIRGCSLILPFMVLYVFSAFLM